MAKQNGMAKQDADASQSKEGEENGAQKKSSISPALILIPVIIVLALVGGYLYLSMSGTKPSTTTTVVSSVSTTIPQSSVSNINGCSVIDKPGVYFLANRINTTITSGACIKVVSSNVRLEGNNNKLVGNGPYTGVPPFTYGIELSGVSNVTVTGFDIETFSYGIYVNNSAGSSYLAAT